MRKTGLGMDCWIWTGVFVCLLFGGSTLLAVPAWTETLQSEISQGEQLRREIEEAEIQLRQAQEDLARLQRQKTGLQSDLQKKQQEEKNLKSQIRDLESRISGRNKELDIYQWNLQKRFPREMNRLQAEQDGIQSRQHQLNWMVGLLIRGGLAWSVDRSSPRSHQSVLCRIALQQLLPDLIRQKAELQQQSRAIQVQLDEIQQKIDLDNLWIKQARQRLATLGEDHSQTSHQLRLSAESRRQAQQEADRVEREIEIRETLAAEIQEQLPLLYQGIDYKPFSEQKGQLFWPIPGEVVYAFGPRKHPDFDLTIKNTGVDLSAVPGEEIRSAADGQIVHSGNLPGYGPLVMLHHGADFFTFYSPASSDELGKGARVKKGQVIARVATSEGASTPLLHFEIRAGEKPLNPLEWLREKPQ